VVNNIAIIGAGVSGLTAGYALRKLGASVDIYERSESVTEFGAGITLSKNATSLLKELGLMDVLLKKGYQPMGSYIRDFKKAKIISYMEFDENFITLDRRDLVEQLSNKLFEIGGNIYFGKDIQLLDPSSGTVQISDQNSKTYDLILICDGIKSSLRNKLFDSSEPIFTNYVAWRGMVEAKHLPSYNGNDKVNVYHGPRSHCVHYPTGHKNFINFVAIEHSDNWLEESWKTEGTREEFKESFKGWNEELLSMFMSSEKLYKWGIFERPIPRTLYEGKCALLGDAAHPMVPFLGQGGCLSIEDAFCISALIDQEKNLGEALQGYDLLRNSRSRKMQKRSKLQGVFNHVSNPFLASMRNMFTKITMRNSVNKIHSYDLKRDLALRIK